MAVDNGHCITVSAEISLFHHPTAEDEEMMIMTFENIETIVICISQRWFPHFLLILSSLPSASFLLISKSGSPSSIIFEYYISLLSQPEHHLGLSSLTFWALKKMFDFNLRSWWPVALPLNEFLGCVALFSIMLMKGDLGFIGNVFYWFLECGCLYDWLYN